MLCFSRLSKVWVAIEVAVLVTEQVQAMEATAALADTAAMEATTVAMEATQGTMATITTEDMVTGIRNNLLVLEIQNAKDALTRI